MFSRNFLRVRPKVLFFQTLTVEITEFFAKIPSNQRFTKELYYKLIWRKKFAWQWLSRFFHTALWNCGWRNYGNLHTLAFFGIQFVKATLLLNLTWKLNWRNISLKRLIPQNKLFNCIKYTQNYPKTKILTRSVDFTKFFQRICNFYTAAA